MMLSFNSASFFSIHHLYVMIFDFIILKTAFVSHSLCCWAWLYIVVIMQKVRKGGKLHFRDLLSEGVWVFLSNPVTLFQKFQYKRAFLKNFLWDNYYFIDMRSKDVLSTNASC